MELGNPYQLHRTIMNAFPSKQKKEEDARILFKIVTDSKKSNPIVLIQSINCPDWSFLIKDNQYLLINPQFKQFDYPKFAKGAKYWFKVFGNPTKKINKKRVGMYKEEEQYDWLRRKAESGGFKLLHVTITRKEEITAKENKDSKEMTFYGVQFEGVLQVEDSQKFENTMKNGIGSGKAFGFGFLTISRL